MMHYIALVMAPVDAPVESVDAVGTPVIGPYEDIVNSRLLFSNGCVANVTASRISQKVERTMRIFQADEYTVADLQNRQLTRVRSAEHTSEIKSLMRITYAVFCMTKKKTKDRQDTI